MGPWNCLQDRWLGLLNAPKGFRAGMTQPMGLPGRALLCNARPGGKSTNKQTGMTNTPEKLPDSKNFAPSSNYKASAQLTNEFVHSIVNRVSPKSRVMRAIHALLLFIFFALFLLYAAAIHPEMFAKKDWAPPLRWGDLRNPSGTHKIFTASFAVATSAVLGIEPV